MGQLLMTMHAPFPDPEAFAKLQPFLRRGRPRPLTLTDYAHAVGKPRTAVEYTLRVFTARGLLQATREEAHKANIYDLTPEGAAVAAGQATRIEAAEPKTGISLRDIASIAFSAPACVRRLLPVVEAEIGEAMAASVPKELRPKVKSDREENLAYDADLLARIVALAVEGASAHRISAEVGAHATTVNRYLRHARRHGLGGLAMEPDA